MIDLLKIQVTDEVLRKLGFSDYDDEHCTWGNRRLLITDSGNWPTGCYKLQIIDQEEDEFDNGYGYHKQEEGFFYAGWFELLKIWKTDDYWQLFTVKDIYKIIYLYHREYLSDFKQILLRLKE